MPEIENNNLNNEKNVEKLLKEYSSSRRIAIGDDVELSPSRRNALLSEALKTHSGHNLSGFLYFLLSLRWVRVGAFAALVLIFLFAGFLVYKNTFEKKGFVIAKKGVKPEQAEQQNVADRKGIVSKTLPEIKEKETPPEKLHEQPELMRTMTPQVAAAKEGGAVRESLSFRGEIDAAKPVPPPAAAEPPKQILARADKAESSKQPLQSRQQGIIENSGNLNKALESFRIELRGSNIVMIESDGSKYEGIALNDFNALTNSIRSETHYKNFIANIQANSLPAGSTKQAQSALNQAVPQVIFFNVNGSNKSLQNYLEFSGRLVQNTTAPSENTTKLSAENTQQNLQFGDRRNVAVQGRPSGGLAATAMRSAPTRMASPQTQAQMKMPPQEIQPQTQSQIPANQAIIEGILTIGNYTNIPIRAIMNSDGSFTRVTNW